MGKTLILLFLLVSCSHQGRSKYKAFKDKEGFREQSEKSFSSVTYQGNEETKTKDALAFARFRSIELCGEKLSYVMNLRDKSEKKEVIRTSGNAYPYYGMGYGSRFSTIGFGFGGGFPMNAWSETQVYPYIEVVYACVDQVRGPHISLREVSREEMKLLVKDLKGGLQVEAVPEDSVNAKILQTGDIILKLAGQRIEKIEELLSFFILKNEGPVHLLREGEKKTLTVRSQDIHKWVASEQESSIKEACGYKEIKKKKSYCP
jgi:hypothetical protein